MKRSKFNKSIPIITLAAAFCLLTSVAAIAGPIELSSSVWSGNGHTYHLLANSGNAGITWTDAESYAVNTLGGHLATVDSQQVSDWLWNTFGKGANINLWIGLTDQVDEGQFKWIANGQAPLFTNWYPGEPNNYENEDYVFILYSSFVGGNGFGAGLWNDGQSNWTGFMAGSNYAIAETTSSSSPVPEPTTMLLLGLGLIGVAGVRRKIQK
jgi:hypothetical protein